MLKRDSQDAPAPLRPRHASRKVVFPLIFLAIGAYCILFPEVILDDPAYAKLPKRAFGTACGLLFVGFAIAAHAHEFWGGKGYARVSHAGQLIGGITFIGAFAYMFKCIVEVAGWPW